MPEDKEKRTAMRLAMQLPIELKNGGRGLTRDFCRKGVYFATDQPMALDEDFEFTVAMRYALSGPMVRLRCQGRVVRLEPAVNGLGVAAMITEQDFESYGAGKSA